MTAVHQHQLTNRIYRKNILNGPYDAIVIGSGIGGLATAALLSKAGQRVLVLERHYVAGGFTHTFSRKGYEWDVGIHYIGEVHRQRSILRRLFDFITDGALEWSRMPEVYDRVIIAGDEYDYIAGVEAFKARLCGYFPDEKKAVDEYVRLVFAATNAAKNFFSARAMPSWMRFPLKPVMTSPFLKYSRKTTREVISSLTSNAKLLGVLTAQYGDYGLPPARSSFAIHAMVAKHYFDGGNYPVGGSGRIAETIVPVIEKGGGKVLVRAEVKEVIVENGRAMGVRLENGDEIRAGSVVSDAGVFNTFGKLLDPALARSLKLDRKLNQVKPSLAHICLYVGMKESAANLGLNQANYWIYPDYDHDKTIARYETDPSAPLPVTYISFPSAKDPDWERRHPGRATLEAIGFAPYKWFTSWEKTSWKKRGNDYEAFKEELTQRLLEQVYRYLPQLRGKIDFCELSTPLSTRHFTNYGQGEIYGIEHTPERFELSWLKPQTPIRNLYLTGQDVVTDGIGGALFGGVLTASVMLKRNLIKEVMRQTV
ncbi:MAG: NAD(P)/FAD-dependent oxidoreductase [Deltaproteobacteria bacterium]|nr:NAD(P)/FAD-dependent oxidoreductase [Deltaproteobacteria bacterium]